VRTEKKKTLVGTVHSDKGTKTITVNVQRRFKHVMYGKYILRTNRFMAHDEKGEARIGDKVEIAETRPLSKNKRWRLLRVLDRAPRHDEGTGA